MFLTQPVWSFSGIALPLMKGKETGIVSHVPYQATNIRLTQLDLALMHFTLSLPTWLIVKPHLEEVEEWGSALIPYFILGCPRKSPNRGGWGHTFSEKKPWNLKIFQFILRKKKSFHSWKFCKIMRHSLEIPRSKTKTHGNLTLVFLEYPWKFHVLKPLFLFGVFSKIAHLS